jgi:excisionase family DNA binding protein
MKEIIQLREVASLLNVNQETARRWAVSGRIPAFRFNGKGRWRAFREDIDKYLAAHQSTAATGQVVSANQ